MTMAARIIVYATSLLLITATQAADPEYGYKQYTEYWPGTDDSRIVLTAPHGGGLRPDDIPPRQDGCYDATTGNCTWTHNCGQKDPTRCRATTVRDMNTIELSRDVVSTFEGLTGIRPHLVICNLHRTRVDMNRPRDQAAQGNPDAERAYDDFMAFIGKAKGKIGKASDHGRGLLLDMHGQAHAEQWIELGYLLSTADLNSGQFTPADTSIRSLAEFTHGRTDFNELLRGSHSLGFFIEKSPIYEGEEYKVVPSPTFLSPGDGNYYSGGHITQTYGSRRGGSIDAIQIESPSSLRNDEPKRKQYGKDLAKAINSFMINYNEPSDGPTWNSRFGHKNYTEYVFGDKASKIILVVPHGGYVEPADIPDRDHGCYNENTKTCTYKKPCGTPNRTMCRASLERDDNTLELATLFFEKITAETGAKPHMIINHLSRTKLDTNRDKPSAAQGEPDADQAWDDYTGFIREAKAQIDGTGLLLDVHGQSHPPAWVELGYTFTRDELNADKLTNINNCSIKALLKRVGTSKWEEVVRGASSFGGLLEAEGFKSVPSPSHRGPGTDGFFTGGYTTETFGSRDSGEIDAVQVESPRYVRNKDEKTVEYAEAVARSLKKLVNTYYCTTCDNHASRLTIGLATLIVHVLMAIFIFDI